MNVGTAPDITDLEAVATAVNDWATGAYSAIMPNTLTWVQIVVTDLNVAGGAQYTKDMSGEGGGDITNDVKTNQDTIAIKFNTARSGRSYRGRAYMLALSAGSYSDANNIGSTALASIVNAFDALRSDLDTAGYPLGVLSRFNQDDVPTPPHKRAEGLLVPVTTVSATNGVVDSQRRRLPGRGT